MRWNPARRLCSQLSRYLKGRVVLGFVVVGLAAGAVLVNLLLLYSNRGEVRDDLEYLDELQVKWGQIAARVPTVMLRALAEDGTAAGATGFSDVRPLVLDLASSIARVESRPWLGRLNEGNESAARSHRHMLGAWTSLQRELFVLSFSTPEEFAYASVQDARPTARSFAAALGSYRERVNEAADAHAARIERLEWSLSALALVLAVFAVFQNRALAVRRRTESRVRALVRSTLSRQEADRSRLAALLQQEVAQTMSAVRLALPSGDECDRWACGKVGRQIEELLQRVQSAGAWLGAGGAAGAGDLREALERTCHEVSMREGVDVSFSAPTDTDGAVLSADTIAATVSLLRRMLDILITHAGADRIAVGEVGGAEKRSLLVYDNGGRFPRAGRFASFDIAMEEVRERARMLGATVSVQQRPSRFSRARRWSKQELRIPQQYKGTEHAAHA